MTDSFGDDISLKGMDHGVMNEEEYSSTTILTNDLKVGNSDFIIKNEGGTPSFDDCINFIRRDSYKGLEEVKFVDKASRVPKTCVDKFLFL